MNLDLTLWREFQAGLSGLLNIPISLSGADGKIIVPPSVENRVCRVELESEGGRRCAESCARAVAKALRTKSIYIFKCHKELFSFVIPVFLDSSSALAIVGGRCHLSGVVASSRGAGGADDVRTMSPHELFTLPGFVEKLAVPVLRGLHAKGLCASELRRRESRRGPLRSIDSLDEAVSTLASLTDREELLKALLDKSIELAGAEQGSVLLLENDGTSLSVKAAKGMDKSIAENLKIRCGEGIAGSIVESGRPVIVTDIEKEGPARKNRPRYKTKSFVSIPLRMESRVIGVLNLSDKITGEVFSEEDLKLLLSLSNYASIAIERGVYYNMIEELKVISVTDELTGIFNRRYFQERLFEEAERAKRHSENFSIFIIDIDDFKALNDRYGHLVGDEVLKGTATAIRDAVRSIDVVARFGGEEFGVILPYTSKIDAFVIAERIRKGVEKYGSVIKGMPFREWPTISLGVAEFPRDAETIEELLYKADKAMYMAKARGKNRVVVSE